MVERKQGNGKVWVVVSCNGKAKHSNAMVKYSTSTQGSSIAALSMGTVRQGRVLRRQSEAVCRIVELGKGKVLVSKIEARQCRLKLHEGDACSLTL